MSFEFIWMFGAAEPSEEKHDSPMHCYFVLQEKAQCFQKALASQADKSTQTELVGHDVSRCIKQYFFIIFVGVLISVSWFASAVVASMHGFGDSKVPSET